MATGLRKLGTTGLEAGPLALGGNVFGWTADKDTSFRVLDAFVAAGLNLIDTADVYSRWAPDNIGGESETVIGMWLRKTGNRGRVVIAHVRVPNPPDPVMADELYERLDPSRYGVQTMEVGPLWDSDLLPQIYVRRVLEAVPQVDETYPPP